MEALSLNLISAQPCAGQEIKKKMEKVQIITFWEIKVSGNIQYTYGGV